MVRKGSKRIVWKKSPTEMAAEVKRLPPIFKVVPRDDDLVLIPGQLFRLRGPMEIVQAHHRYQQPPVPYAIESYYSTAFPMGSYAIFLGHTRVEEMDGTHIRSLLRPTFMVNGVKIIPANLNHLELVS